ncbi:hypothetical protein DPMN_147209 [Dreissena polymorpha]|uniref:Uncharacterized protein n=1 Tax=Dreissena polymorpha TaxID=45954 RepID=A0A9D4FBT2_DREPO|nr:hypothetical protein DPMN_147209 [Dreissena polymorpha]
MSPFQDGPPPVVKPSLIEAPIMDRLLNLFSTVSISGWPSPGGETLSDRGPHHGQAAQPVLCGLQLSLYFRMALPRW